MWVTKHVPDKFIKRHPEFTQARSVSSHYGILRTYHKGQWLLPPVNVKWVEAAMKLLIPIRELTTGGYHVNIEGNER